MAAGQPALRSVDSEHAGRVIEPRNYGSRGSRRRRKRGRQHRSAAVAERRGPTGVGEQGTHAKGLFRNLGDPVVSVDESGWGHPVTSPWPVSVVFTPTGANKSTATVPGNEGNEGQTGRSTERSRLALGGAAIYGSRDSPGGPYLKKHTAGASTPIARRSSDRRLPSRRARRRQSAAICRAAAHRVINRLGSICAAICDIRTLIEVRIDSACGVGRR